MNKELVFTDDQKHAIERAVETLSKPETIFQISGPGGSGKTTISKQISGRLFSSGAIVKVIYCAPTHKACKVLRDATTQPAQTLQSFLNMEVDYDERGNTIYQLGTPKIVTTYEEGHYNLSQREVFEKTLLLIDEISMVSEEILKVIIEYQKLLRFRIITLGDSAQLPPVNQDDPAFYSHFPIDIQFSQNMRNSDIAYNELLTRIRDMILKSQTDIKPFDIYKLLKNGERGGVVDLCPHILKGSRKHKEIKLKSLVRAVRMVDYDKDMLLAYRTNSATSKTVSKLNKRARRQLYGKEAREYMVGERLMVTGYHLLYCLTHGRYNHVCHKELSENVSKKDMALMCLSLCRLNKCDELVVEKVDQTKSYFYGKPFTTWCLQVRTECKNIIPIYRVVKEEQAEFNEYRKNVWKECKDECVVLNRDKRRESWNWHYKSLSTIHAPVQYAYAMSVHMSQGSTTSDVFLNMTDFLWLLYNPTSENATLFLKLLYTGLSRAKCKAVVF